MRITFDIGLSSFFYIKYERLRSTAGSFFIAKKHQMEEQQMNEKKPYIVFNMKLAGKLMVLGFVLLKIEKALEEGSRRSVFYFRDSIALRKAINEINNK